MILRRSMVALGVLLLAACASEPRQPVADGARPGSDETAPRVVVARPAPHTAPLPAMDLSEELMLKLMVAEVAMQRGQAQDAVGIYLELARETGDPRIAQRATELAWSARLVSAAIEAAGIWLQIDPTATQARQVMATLLVSQSQLTDAQPHLERWLAADPDRVGQAFLQLNGLLARHKDKQAVLKLVQALAEKYPEIPEARLTVAQAAWNAQEQQLSLDEARAALKLRPDWEFAALFVAQVLQRRSDAEAAAFLAEFLAANPKARDVQLNYARLLVNEKKFAQAREQFEALVREYPQNADVGMAVALLAIQAKDYEAADAQLRRVLELNYKDPDTARFYLGQVNEERKLYDEALKWYSSVEGGQQHVTAMARYAAVLAKQGKLPEARRYLQQAPVDNNQQRVQLTQAEAQLLREASDYQAAFDLLGDALQKLPDYPDLLYDHAMAAEKLNRLDVLEGNLRKLIAIRPDYAHAYNALGYSLADRNQRVDEAYRLIEQALKLAPEDPFIMDSMGWVLYRMGRLQDGLSYVQRAFDARPDPEIAAHLGELLWSSGDQGGARKVWDDALKQSPDNEVLRATIKRFVR